MLSIRDYIHYICIHSNNFNLIFIIITIIITDKAYLCRSHY